MALNRQQGISLLPVLFGFIFLVLLLRIPFSLAQIYWQNILVGNTLDTLIESGQMKRDMKDSEAVILIADTLSRSQLSIPTDEMVLTRTFNDLNLTWTYEVRSHFIGNIDFVTTFQHKKVFQFE